MKGGYQGLVFDCDGVLFDSHPANLAYYNTVLGELGASLVAADDQARAQLCHTACSRDVFKELLGDAQVETALEIAGSLDYREFLPFLQPHEGMLDILPQLARHYPLALATNRTATVTVLLEHFGIRSYFKAVVTSSDVLMPKPHPDMLHLAAQRLGYLEKDLVFVGDALSDMQAAGAAGCDFVAFGSHLDVAPRVSCWSEFSAWLPRKSA